jgi:type IX secretion system substrate protein
MKKLTRFGVLFIALTASSFVFAQTPSVAMDFNQFDCAGAEHSLFSELDAGDVVLLEFAMNCQACENARTALESVEAEFAESRPGKFRIYVMSYTNSTNCTKMSAWPVVKNHESPSFVGVADQLDYYGGFGMPTLVLVAGKDHKVIYNRTGFPTKDSLIQIELQKITDIINGAFTAAAVTDVVTEPFALYPNPAHDKVHLALPAQSDAEVRIVNVLGEEVFRDKVLGAEMELNIASLPNGFYTLMLKGVGIEKRAILVKQ